MISFIGLNDLNDNDNELIFVLYINKSYLLNFILFIFKNRNGFVTKDSSDRVYIPRNNVMNLSSKKKFMRNF